LDDTMLLIPELGNADAAATAVYVLTARQATAKGYVHRSVSELCTPRQRYRQGA
jgi:hypothetical protein